MSSKLVINGKVIEVIMGDITKLSIEAIVNPANSLMIMGGGVAGAIRRVGGDVIEAEARRYAPVPIGKAVITTAGKLPSKYVIHSPTMEKPAMRTTKEKVRKAVKAALEVAEERGIKEVAFPGMGTGVGGVPPNEAAEVMINEILKFLKESRNLRRVVLVAFNNELYEAFENSLRRVKEGLGQG